MYTRNPDFVMIDMSRPQGRAGELRSGPPGARVGAGSSAVARELGQSESVPQSVADAGSLGASHVPRVKLSIRLTTPEAKRLAVDAHIAQLSRDAYLAGLITGVPALTTGASRTEQIVELIKSNAQLSSHSASAREGQVLLEKGLET